MPLLNNFLRSVTGGKIWSALAIFCFFSLVMFIFMRKRRIEKAVMFSIWTTGFAEISFQIAVIFSFQFIYGYMFYKLGLIVTSFMVGLALGGWYISRNVDRIKNDMLFYRWTQVSICIYPLILPVVFIWLSETRSGIASWLGSNIIFPFLPVIAGAIGGIQFPLANKIYLGNSPAVGKVAGLSYGLDLLGACIGSMFASAILVPVLGLFQTCFFVAIINVVVLLILSLNERRDK